MVKLDNNYWQEVITSVINAIGTDEFSRLSAAALERAANEYTQEGEEWPTIGRERDEWKHEAVEAMKLKR